MVDLGLVCLAKAKNGIHRKRKSSRQQNSNLETINQMPAISILPNCSKHEEYMEKLLQLDLVKDLKTMVAKERTVPWQNC